MALDGCELALGDWLVIPNQTVVAVSSRPTEFVLFYSRTSAVVNVILFVFFFG